jgi:hypothetical protein
MKHVRILWIYLKGLLRLPIYRIDVLNWAEYFYVGSCDCSGLCDALYFSCANLNLYNYTPLQIYFPKYTRQNAQMFPYNYINEAYWWRAWNWDENGRLGFFYWLKEQYKKDRTNLRKINIEEI